MKKQELLWWMYALLLLLGLYFFTRFVAIRSLPPFNDEFIYVRWAQEGFFDPARRLASLSDGKQPLYIWLVSLLMNLVPSPLAAGRIVSILAGAVSMLGLVVLAFQLFKKRATAIVAGTLYIVNPLALLLDRFALYDSLLTTLTVWGLVVMYHLTQHPSLGSSLVLALLLGAALLTKSSAALLLSFFLLMALFFAKKGKPKLLSIGYLLLAGLVALLYQSVQQLSPAAHSIAEKNTTFVYSWDQLRSQPIISRVAHNLVVYGGWVAFYLSVPLLLAGSSGWFTNRRNRQTYTFLWLAFLIPFLVVVGIGKTVYPRHIFFLTMPLFVAGAGALVHLWETIRHNGLRVTLFLLCVVPATYLSGRILIDYKMALLPAIDRFQYIDGWPAGWGVKDIVRFLEPETAKGTMTILTEGKFGSMPTTAMQLYFGNYPQVHIVPIDENTLDFPRDLDWKQPVYVILNKAQEVPNAWNAVEILKIQKGIGDSYIRLLRLAPDGR